MPSALSFFYRTKNCCDIRAIANNNTPSVSDTEGVL